MRQPSLLQPASLSVTELTQYMRALVESDDVLRDVWVMGEVSNLSRPSSGHIYFTLKDGGAALKCVIWRSAAVRIRFGLQNGLAVEAHGAIGIYERDGQYQLYVDSLRPAGEGLLFQEFLRLKSQLEAEGLFDPERKRQIPERPRVIGIVTSPTGAALQDMLNTLAKRYPLAEVVISPCAVQGDAAPGEIVRALRGLCRFEQPDVIIVARGGGSLEDLWAYNDEQVVRAIAGSPVPVITGIGHETDFTLSDFAADVRAPTPTGAAVIAAPDRSDMMTELNGLYSQLASAAAGVVNYRQIDLDHLRTRLEHASPGQRILGERQRLNERLEQAERALRHAFQIRRAHLSGMDNRLAALNPDAVLKRGYAIVSRGDGSRIHSAAEAHDGEQVDVRMQDGVIKAVVQQVRVDNEL